MPVKNAAPWLVDCILSIQNQAFTDWQLVAVDDFSTDQSLEILNNFSLRDSRISVLQNKEAGITNALQLAFENCSGTYISRMDADDLMPPKKLETLLKIASQNHNSVATGKVKYFSKHPISAGYLTYQNWLNQRVDFADFHQHVFRECVLASPNWLTHRKNIESVAPFTNHVYPEDYDLVFRWIKNGNEIIGVDEETHLWREHKKRTSRTSELYNQQHFFKLKLHWFLRLKFTSDKNLVVFGDNSKAKICTTFFTEKEISFIQITKNNLHQLATIANPLVLCTVFTDDKTNAEIENFYAQNNLVLGESWWYV